MNAGFLDDPYPALAILRDNYPCYRDWRSNAFWISRYNDVTSILVDDANYESRPKRWFYGIGDYGRDLGQQLPVLTAQSQAFEVEVPRIMQGIIDRAMPAGKIDMATGFAARLPIELLARCLGIPEQDFSFFANAYWRMQHGYQWEPKAQHDGLAAIRSLTEYFQPLLGERRQNPTDDLISVVAALTLEDGPATAEDLVTTLLEADHETLHGGLANMWYLLLTHQTQLEAIKSTQRLVKHAWLETLRHSPPVLASRRFARHEVERFGQLFPEGAMIICSAAAANRDPEIFGDADKFNVERKDLCQREPRGMYRADGLPAGIAFGLGKPSKHPAIPEDRPISLYALTRNAAVDVSTMILDQLPNLRLPVDVNPRLHSMSLGEMHTCWHLPAEFDI
ncbi:MAG: cytochrome P450 [bacterium]|nr:cytochrome P450 [Gammaproteobacteria bacterium]